IGRKDAPRNPIVVELVRWQDALSAYHNIVVRVDAGDDVVLDLTANRRTDESAATPFTITIERINAGDDVDVVLNDSKSGTDIAAGVLVIVNLYNPGTTFYRFSYPATYTPPATADAGPLSPCSGVCGSGSGRYRTHFRPDAADPGLDKILRAFGTVTADRESTYIFSAVRAGDDIDICHVTTTSVEEPKTCPTTAIDDTTHIVTADAVADATVHVTANTDADWAAVTPPAELDDPGIAIDLPQVFIRTNGNIVDTELADGGDLLVGHIHSTQGNVTLSSPIRILDANRMPTIDVTGVSITMTAGTALGA